MSHISFHFAVLLILLLLLNSVQVAEIFGRILHERKILLLLLLLQNLIVRRDEILLNEMIRWRVMLIDQNRCVAGDAAVISCIYAIG